MQACRALTDVLDRAASRRLGRGRRAPARADAERRCSASTAIPIAIASRRHARAARNSSPPDAPVGEALTRMIGRADLLAVRASGRAGDRRAAAAETGIVTERDVLRALAKHGAAALDAAGRAIHEPAAGGGAGGRLRLSRHRPDEPAEDPPSRRRPTRPAASSARCRRAICCGCAPARPSRSATRSTRRATCHALAAAWAKLPQVAAALLAEGLSGTRHRGGDLARARRADAARRRARRAAHARSAAAGEPPCAVRVRGARLGRPRRKPAGDGPGQRAGFRRGRAGRRGGSLVRRSSATHVADILHEVGVPYCKGGVMAKNPQWRGSVATWRDAHRRLDRALQPAGSAVGRHLLRPARCTATPPGRRAVAAAFDAAKGRPVSPSCWPKPPAASSRPGLFRRLQDRAGPHRSEEDRAVRHRHRGARARHPPSRGRALDAGAACRHQGARHRRRERSRRARRGAGRLSRSHPGAADRRHRAGHAAANAVAVKRLSGRDRDRLRSALEAVAPADALTRDLLFRD